MGTSGNESDEFDYQGQRYTTWSQAGDSWGFLGDSGSNDRVPEDNSINNGCGGNGFEQDAFNITSRNSQDKSKNRTGLLTCILLGGLITGIAFLKGCQYSTKSLRDNQINENYSERLSSNDLSKRL